MDYTQNLSDLTAASSAQSSASAQALGVKAGIDAAIEIIKAGYQSDADAIASQVQAQISDITTILQNLGCNPDGTPIVAAPPTNDQPS